MFINDFKTSGVTILNAWFRLGPINSSPVYCLIFSPKIFWWEHQKFVALNSSPKMKGDALTMKYQRFHIYCWFVTFHLLPYDQGFEHQRNTDILTYINNKFEISF